MRVRRYKGRHGGRSTLVWPVAAGVVMNGPGSGASDQRRWRSLLALAASLAVAAAITGPPSHSPAAGPTATDTAGPIRLHDAWPSATTVTIDASLPGGLIFHPLAVADARTIVGVAAADDQSPVQLVVRRADQPPRPLRTMPRSDVRAVAAAVVSGDQVYWLESGSDSNGQGTTSLWRSGLLAGAARLLSTAVSVPAFSGSQYDLELADGRLYWAAYLPRGRGEIRSVSVDGGRVQVRSFDRTYSLTAWPWATSSAAGVVGDIDMVNLLTGERRTVHASSNQNLNCTPTWCRVTTMASGKTDVTITFQHPDGSHVLQFPNHSLSPAGTDVALLDRFDLAQSPGDPNLATPNQKLWLHDLTNGRDLLLDANATDFGTRDGFVWWSTGDQATVWHLLDLRTLN